MAWTLTLICPLQVGFNKSGKVQALDCKLYNNAGNSLDLSAAIMDRALLHVDAAYKIPHVRVVGYCCKTNIASNTAFRGFGGPQVSILPVRLVFMPLMMMTSASAAWRWPCEIWEKEQGVSKQGGRREARCGGRGGRDTQARTGRTGEGV